LNVLCWPSVVLELAMTPRLRLREANHTQTQKLNR
jgi:hypothetical protein